MTCSISVQSSTYYWVDLVAWTIYLTIVILKVNILFFLYFQGILKFLFCILSTKPMHTFNKLIKNDEYQALLCFVCVCINRRYNQSAKYNDNFFDFIYHNSEKLWNNTVIKINKSHSAMWQRSKGLDCQLYSVMINSLHQCRLLMPLMKIPNTPKATIGNRFNYLW